METTIQLSYPEIMQAATIGVMRRMQRLKSGYALAHGLKAGKDWQLMIEGALSECALAKFLNVYWVGCGEINDVDVGDVDVRRVMSSLRLDAVTNLGVKTLCQHPTLESLDH